MSKIKSFNNLFLYKVFFSFFLFIIFLHANLDDLTLKIQQFCGDVYSLLPPISMLLVIAGAVTFAAGQLASAETRARATGWATAMIVGAIFGFVLFALLPPIIASLYKSDTWTKYCRIP